MILFHVPLLTEKFRVDREESTPHRHMFGMWRFLIKLVTVPGTCPCSNVYVFVLGSRGGRAKRANQASGHSEGDMAEEALNAEKEALDSYFQGEDADIRVRAGVDAPK